jgi:hypothetical protein
MRNVSSVTAFRLLFAAVILLAACSGGGGPKVTCGGIAGKACAGGQICDLPAGHCAGGDQTGVCVAKPDSCNQKAEPVCGCDGNSYLNDCMRLMAGVNKDHDGECQKPG